jgi:Flp pilus assembly protein TadD
VAFYRVELSAVQAAAMERNEKRERIAQLRRGMISADTQLGNWSETRDQYVELINAYPEDASLTQEAALVAGAYGEREPLLGFYRKTVEASPRDARWSIVLARLETALEDYPSAIDAYSKAIHVRPEQKDLYEAKAGLEERLHRLDDAVADYEQLYKLSYRDPQWMVKAAEARARQGRGADAVKALVEAWITGRPPQATNYFEVATRLEQWGLLDEARGFAEQGMDAAGADLLVASKTQTGAVVYARIMARERQSDTAFTHLAITRMKEENVPLTAVAEQGLKEGLGAITNEDWRKQRIAERTTQAQSGFAQALRSMASVVNDYYTPEEKTQFASWLQTKSATAVDGAELRAVYLPAMRAAGLKEMEAELLWQFTEKGDHSKQSELNEWLQLQTQRVQLDGVGAKIEGLAASTEPKYRAPILHSAAEVYRTLGDASGELRVLDQLAVSGGVDLPRYYELLLATQPQTLVSRATGPGAAREISTNSAAQYLIANGKPDQAFAGISARSSGLPAVWKKAYTGLTGLYLREHTSQVREGFADALGNDATIGERIAHPADRNQQLAGELWFYYASRFGEYLDEEKDAQAESYLEAELEHTPESADAYLQLADYTAQAGRADAALVDYQYSLDRKSDQPAVLDNIAAIEWKQGRQTEALVAWQLAVQRLAAEIDERPVPESFWGGFTQVLGDVAAHGQYATISAQVDALLRVYLARNGDYRVEPLLEAGYHAHGDSMAWLFEITAAADNPTEVLNSVWSSNWIAKGQSSQLLAHIVELKRSKLQSNPSEDSYGLDYEESTLADALIGEGKLAEAHAEFTRISTEKQRSQQWLGVELRLAEAEGHLPQLIEQWKKHSINAPTAGDLQSLVLNLSESSQHIVLRFVYERALDARELTAPNFLGLAAIDLDEGNATDAVALLRRLALISDNLWADTDSAASLLEKHGRYADAIQFLQPLVEAQAWDASYKVRLAAATLVVDVQSQQAIQTLTAVANDPKTKYAVRVAAAKALKGHVAMNIATDSAELNLLARSACPGADAVDRPFFVQTRMAAAACALSDVQREGILRSAIAIDPKNAELRLQYISAAFVAGVDAHALLAAKEILVSNRWFYQQRFSQDGEAFQNENDSDQQKMPTLSTLKPDEALKLTWFAIHAREKRHENDLALQLAHNAQFIEKEPQHTIQDEIARLKLEAARNEENESRAPNIHGELAQDRVVRPRLLPGMPFTPKKSARNEDGEGAE